MGKYISVDVLKANRYIIVGDDTVGERDYITFDEIDSLPSIDITFCEEWEPLKNGFENFLKLFFRLFFSDSS